MIKEYFSNYALHTSDTTIDLKNKKLTVHKKTTENWKITLVDTGEETMTGGRILKIKNYVDENFCLTYGDGLCDVNVKKLVQFHKSNNKLATMTVVQPQGRFGIVEISKKNNLVVNFSEKPNGDGSWINGGFFVLKKDIFKYLKDDSTVWEREPLENLSKNSQLLAFQHNGFWYAMDTIRDKNYLDSLWFSKKAPWKLWNEK